VLRYWVMYAHMMAWGALVILFGFAIRTAQSGRWLAIAVLGLPLIALGLMGLLGESRKLPMPAFSESRTLLLIGMGWFLLGTWCVVYTWADYPWVGELTRQQAPWLKWVFIAAGCLAAIDGLGMSYLAIRKR